MNIVVLAITLIASCRLPSLQHCTMYLRILCLPACVCDEAGIGKHMLPRLDFRQMPGRPHSSVECTRRMTLAGDNVSHGQTSNLYSSHEAIESRDCIDFHTSYIAILRFGCLYRSEAQGPAQTESLCLGSWGLSWPRLSSIIARMYS